MRPEDFLQGSDFDVISADQFLGGNDFETQQEKISRLQGEANVAKAESDKMNTKGATVGRFFKSLIPETAKVLLQTPARFVASSALAPVDLARTAAGKQPLNVNIPGVGKTFQAKGAQEIDQLYDKAYEGNLGKYEQLKALKPFGEVPLAAMETVATAKGIAKAVEKTPRIFKSAINNVSDKLASRADAKTLEFARELTSRPINEKVAQEAIAKGSKGYKAPGIFSKAKVLSTPQDDKVAEAVVPYIKKGASDVENLDRINGGVSEINMGVRNMIADNDIEYPTSELVNYVNKVKKENKLIFASDSSAEKTYDAVIEEFMKHVASKPTKNLSVVNYTTGDYKAGPKVSSILDLFDGRQTFDPTMSKKFPNAFKKDVTGQFLDPKDNIRYNAILDVRRAANEFIADKLPRFNPYRAALRNESYMMDALKRIGTKLASNTQTAGIIGKNKVQILAEQYPFLKVVLGGAAAGLGLGAVGVGNAIIRSTD